MNKMKKDMLIYEDIKKFYTGRRVLVAGADGFIGFNMILRLRELGAQISLISRNKQPRAACHTCAQIFYGDLREKEMVKQAIKGQDIVFDLAGASGSVTSNQDPFRHLEEECSPHLNLFQTCAEEVHPPVTIFCSTRLVYGRPSYLPIDELHPLAPRTIYAVHKITLENYLQVFGKIYKLPFIIMRLSNPYGPYQPSKTKNYGIINLFLKSAASSEPIHIFGDGAQKRDYVFIDDVITTFLLLARNKECYGRVFNYGGTESVSIAEAVNLLQELVSNLVVEHKPWPKDYQQVETGDYCTDLAKINQYISLPSQTSLREGFIKTLEYYKQLDG
jgi:nucleoside-diphosphate-sugar epimerase